MHKILYTYNNILKRRPNNMNFYQAFDNIKAGISDVDKNKFNHDFAIQLTMTNKDCGGIFYIEYKDGELNIEPYNYYDHNVDVSAGYSDLCKALGGKLNINEASEKGKLALSGDSSLFTTFISAVTFKEPAKKTVKKPTAKKAAPKKESSKTEAKKTAAKKETKKEETKAAVRASSTKAAAKNASQREKNSK